MIMCHSQLMCCEQLRDMQMSVKIAYKYNTCSFIDGFDVIKLNADAKSLSA